MAGVSFLAALFLALHLDQGWWSIIWAILAASIGQIMIIKERV